MTTTWGGDGDGDGEGEGGCTLSTLLPTTILTTAGETYVSSSEYHRGSASNDSLLDTSYTAERHHTPYRQIGCQMMGGGGRGEADLGRCPARRDSTRTLSCGSALAPQCPATQRPNKLLLKLDEIVQ